MRRVLQRWRPLASAAVVVLLAVIPAAASGSRQASAAVDPCAPIVSPVACENSKPGSPPSAWQVGGNGDSTIVGFATDTSVDHGSTINFKVKTDASAYTITIFRLGYYQGNGARQVATVTPSAQLPQTQPACLTDSTTHLVDCGNWSVSASWNVPADAVSGIYIALLTRSDTHGASQIPFIVRADDSHSDVLFQADDTSWNAYNTYGGWSLYRPDTSTRAYAVSFNRPYTTRTDNPLTYVWADDYPMLRWMEQNGYDVSYFSGVDTDRYGSELLNHKTFLSIGHDEYWSGQQRANVEAARAAGVNLAFFSGNEVFWKTRYQASMDSSATSYRTLVCYKETAANAKIDPSPQWTGTWADPRFSPPADGGKPANALTGQEFMVNGYREDAITVPAAYGKLRLWRNTSVATLAAGATATFPVGTLGYEWDEDVDNGSRPAGEFDLSSTTLSVQTVLQDWGNTYAPGTATHSLSEYRAASGALVFGAGTAQWAWGLDQNHDINSSTPAQPPDPRMQQATVNLLADMGAQPATLQSTLVAASMSTDHSAPTSTITSPTSSTSIHANAPVTISGTATDGGGGVVGGIEVSWDNGATWHEASGTSSWSYTWTPATAGTAVIRSRAVDDSGNVETPSAGVTVQVQAGVNLVAAYAFNEGTGTIAHDASPAANDGTITNATWTTGKYGGGLLFNGTNAWVTVPDAASLDLTTGMTLEAWVDPSATGTAWRTALMKENGGGLAYAIYANTSSSSPSGYAGGAQAQGTSQVPLNTWTHLAVTYDGSTVRLYVNGTQVGTQPSTAGIPVSNGALRIGGNSIWGEYFQGIIDEVRIYKAALTATQIQADMTAPIQTTPADTTPPTVSMTAPANNASLTGTVTLSANAADNVGVVGVQFKLDGQNLGAELTTAPYTLQWDTTQTSNGTHTLTAVARDAAGNLTTSNTVTVTTSNVDATPPSVSITAPVSGTNVSGVVAVTANATDNQGVAGVQFQLDGQNLGAEDTTAPYAIAWDTSGALGPHTLSAVARDAAGNTASAPAVNVTVVIVDTTPPTVSITAPANNATVSGSVSLTASAADNVGVAGVTFRIDGSTIGSEDTTSPYGITWDSTTVGNGSHTLTAVARDAAGNTTTSTAVSITVANALTGVVAAYSFNEGSGTTVADTSGRGNTGTITNATWTAAGKFGGALSFNGTNAWVTVPDSASLDLTTGMTLEAWLDPASLSSWRAALLKETSNDLAWAIYANTSSNTPSGYAGQTQVVGSSVLPLNAWSFVVVTYDRTALKIYLNGTLVSTQPTTVVMPTSTQPLRIGGDSIWGEYFNGKIDDIRIYNRALSASEVTSDMATPVQAPAPDTTAPTVTLTSPTSNATVGGTVSLAATATDNVGVAGVQFKLDGQNLGSEATTAPYTLSWDSTAAANGTHTLSAVARDAAGNTATSTVTVTVSNDHTAPTVSFSAPPPNGTISGTVALSATASDNVGVTNVQFKLDGSNLGAADTTLPYSVNWDTTTATNGTHTLSAVASDAAGNTQTATETVTVSNVDSVPPTVSLTAPSNNATVSGSIPVSANATDNVSVASVQFKLDGSNLGSPDTTAPYSVTWATTGAANGTHTLTAVASDQAGNSTTSATVTVTVSNDLTPPTVSLSAPAAGATVTGSTVTVSANAADNVGVSSVQFKLDGANLGSADTTSPYSISWDSTTATNGTHTLTAVATDAAGNATTSASVSVTVSNVSVVAGLVAAYSFDEGTGTAAGDSSGLGNTGTLLNATWKTTGKYGNALSFNGTNAWVTVPDSPSLDLTTGMTIEAWLDPATLASWRAALIKETSNDLAWGIYANTSSNRWSGNVGSYELDSRAQLPLNTWTFVTVTYDKSQIRLYLNGGLISNTPATITMATSTQPLRIGGDAIWGEYFNGMIDNIRIYNRALSTAEITADMSKPVGAGG